MKTSIQLSQKNLFFGLLYTFLEKYTGYAETVYDTLSKKNIIKNLDDKRDTRFRHSIRVTESKTRELSVEKKFVFKYKHMKYMQFINEIMMLRILNTFGKNLRVSFPKLLHTQIRNHSIAISMEYISGSELKKNTPNQDMFIIIKNVLSSYEEITKRLPNRMLTQLPKRTFVDTVVSFPFYLFCAVIKNPKNVKLYGELSIIYYLHVIEQCLSQHKIMYVLAHRDLHRNNIINTGKKIVVIDNEITCLAEKYTDLAIIARYYFPQLKSAGTTKLLMLSVPNAGEMKAFIRLSIFYTIQAIAFESKENIFYAETKSYLPFLYTLATKNNYKSTIPTKLSKALSSALKVSI